MSKDSKNNQHTTQDGSEEYTHLAPRVIPKVQSRIQPKVQSKIQPRSLMPSGKETQTETSTQDQLPEEVQAKMENSFSQDFSNVTIHKDSSSAENINAKAYTQGTDIHFAPGEYNPNSKNGQELIGHELTHVVQQGQGKVGAGEIHGKGLEINQDAGLEKEADDAGKLASEGKSVEVMGVGSGVQRKETDGYGATINHTVKKGETIDAIIGSSFKTYNEGQRLDLRNQIILINQLPLDGAVKENSILRIPDLHLGTKSDEQSILYGNVKTTEDNNGVAFASAPILGTNNFTSVLGGNKIRRHAFALSFEQWKTLFKEQKLDEISGYRYWAESFIKLAMGDYTLSSGPGQDGWTIYRTPNLGEITAFIKALYSPDVDLIDSYTEINDSTIGTIIYLEGMSDFIKKYQPIVFELDAMRNLGAKNIKDSRGGHFNVENIEAFAAESITIANDKEIFYASYNSAYKTMAKGMTYVIAGDKGPSQNKDLNFALGSEMISNSVKLFKYLLQANDQKLAQDKMISGAVIDALVSAIPLNEHFDPLKSLISSAITDMIIGTCTLQNADKQLDLIGEVYQNYINAMSLLSDKDQRISNEALGALKVAFSFSK